MRRRLGLLAWLMVMAASSIAGAQDEASRATVRDLATSGVEAFQRGQYADASSKLEKAYKVMRVPTLGLWSARALAKLGKLVSASERYREVTRLDAAAGASDAAVQKQAQADAASELDALNPRLPTLTVRLAGASFEDATVEVDGIVVPAALASEKRPVDPGKHEVVAKRGADTAKAEVNLAEGESKEALLTFAPTAASSPVAAGSGTSNVAAGDSAAPTSGLGTQRTLALVVGGVGLVGVGVGSFFGLQASSKLEEANQHGCGTVCTTRQGHQANEDAVSAGNISTIAFAAGALGLAGGITLWLTAPSKSAGSSVGLGIDGIHWRSTW